MSAKRKNVSLKQLASRTNLSPATISRVINNKGRLSDATRERVKALVRETGYAPNRAARALRTQSARAIGLVVPDITNEFFSLIVRAAQRVFFENDYSLFTCDASEEQRKNNGILRDLLGKHIDGMLYISRFTPIPESSQLPMVCLDRLHHQPEGLASVTSNNRMGGRLAARALLDAGCVRPAILCSHEDLELLLTVNDRFQGFRQELAENHISLDKRDIIFSSLSIPESRQTIRRLVKRSRNFDGLFATSDISAIGAMAGLADNGVRVPEEVKVIGFDDISYCRYVNPSLSTIRQDTTRLGEEAARMLLEMLEGRGEGMGNLEIPVELVRRDSTAVLGCRRYKTPGVPRLGVD